MKFAQKMKKKRGVSCCASFVLPEAAPLFTLRHITILKKNRHALGHIGMMGHSISCLVGSGSSASDARRAHGSAKQE
jgi:hypothetical protein